jgi:uncharacterized protein YjbI with pentapeptide repeats
LQRQPLLGQHPTKPHPADIDHASLTATDFHRAILRKCDYPPDKQEKATQAVLEQAKLLCAEWAE